MIQRRKKCRWWSLRTKSTYEINTDAKENELSNTTMAQNWRKFAHFHVEFGQIDLIFRKVELYLLKPVPKKERTPPKLWSNLRGFFLYLVFLSFEINAMIFVSAICNVTKTWNVIVRRESIWTKLRKRPCAAVVDHKSTKINYFSTNGFRNKENNGKTSFFPLYYRYRLILFPFFQSRRLELLYTTITIMNLCLFCFFVYYLHPFKQFSFDLSCTNTCFC